MITQGRHEQVEAIRLRDDGERASLLSRSTRKADERGRGCRYFYERDDG